MTFVVHEDKFLSFLKNSKSYEFPEVCLGCTASRLTSACGKGFNLWRHFDNCLDLRLCPMELLVLGRYVLLLALKNTSKRLAEGQLLKRLWPRALPHESYDVIIDSEGFHSMILTVGLFCKNK